MLGREATCAGAEVVEVGSDKVAGAVVAASGDVDAEKSGEAGATGEAGVAGATGEAGVAGAADGADVVGETGVAGAADGADLADEAGVRDAGAGDADDTGEAGAVCDGPEGDAGPALLEGLASSWATEDPAEGEADRVGMHDPGASIEVEAGAACSMQVLS